jgi:hypothetical protein
MLTNNQHQNVIISYTYINPTSVKHPNRQATPTTGKRTGTIINKLFYFKQLLTSNNSSSLQQLYQQNESKNK